ncbi:MAG TPA: hypothetical protein VH518_19140, partial [Tepidisphaeraceae bacterium]
MSNRVTLALSWALALAFLGAKLSAGELGYYRQPTIAGDQIAFTAEGDLWKVSTAGGLAVRLTSHPASESFAHFSPDGKWIAFTADYEGNSDIYVMSANGGEPVRLTFHPSREECIGWTPDGKFILFRVRRSGLDSLSMMYKVPREGGDPQRVEVGACEAASFSSDGKMIALNQFVWNGTWKRYRGGTAPRIWVGDLQAGKFWRISNEDAVDQNPLWIGDRIYFISERSIPTNIWSCKPDGSDAKQVTHHSGFDVRWADTDGKNIVYTVAAELWLLDVKSGQSKKVETTLPSDRIRQRPHVEDASKTLESFDINEDGKRIVVSSRGEIWNAPAKPGGRVIQITDNDSGIRQRLPVFSPDGKKVLCITDETGEQELALYDSAGKEKHRILTHGAKGWLFQPLWAPDGKHIAYGDLTGTLYLVDPESGEAKTVDQDHNWELTEYQFSPDGKWLAYSKIGDNRMQNLWLYEIASSKSTQISAGFTNDSSPAWDPEGKYLYFLSQRVFRPELDDLDASFLVTRSAKPCLVILAKDGKSPLLPDEMLDKDKDDKDDDGNGNGNSNSENGSTTKPSTGPATAPATARANGESKKNGKKNAKNGEKKELPKVTIDLEGIQQRQVELPVDRDNCRALTAVEDKIFWITTETQAMGEDDEDPDRGAGKLHAYDFEKRKDEVYIENIRSYAISGDGNKIAWGKDKDILIADTSGKPGNDIEDKVAVNGLPLLVNPVEEWRQIYADAWRLQRDFYWAQNMVGVDWEQMRKKYEPLLDR